MIEAKKWIDMAEDADEEKELDKIINEDFNDDAETVKYFSLPLKSPNVVRFEFSDDENSENDDIKQDKTFKKPRAVIIKN